MERRRRRTTPVYRSSRPRAPRVIGDTGERCDRHVCRRRRPAGRPGRRGTRGPGRCRPASPGRVEHPRLHGGAAARGLAQAQDAPLLGVVGQRGGLDQEIAARGRPARGHAVVVGVAGQQRDHPRVAVEQGEGVGGPGHLGQRLVADHHHPAVTGRPQLARQPRDLRRDEHARRADVAAHGVERDHADPAPRVEGLVHARPGAAVSARRAQAGDRLGRAELAPGRIGRDPPGLARQAAREDAVDERGGEGVLAARHVQALRGLGQQLVAGGHRRGRLGAGDLAGEQQVVVAGTTYQGARSPGARNGRCAASSSPGWRGGSTSGR